GNLCTTKHTKSTKVSENEAMDVSFQSSCFSCPSWSLELSSVVDAQSGECACQLYRVLRGGRRTRCPSYMGRTDVDLSRPAGCGVLLVRRTSCPSPLEPEPVETEVRRTSRVRSPAGRLAAERSVPGTNGPFNRSPCRHQSRRLRCRHLLNRHRCRHRVRHRVRHRCHHRVRHRCHHRVRHQSHRRDHRRDRH
ncbi:MAG: hypothetical protein RLY70_874, partial [Planctomycetota bacterium]